MKFNYYRFISVLLLLFFTSYFSQKTYSQCDTCNSTITFYIDLSSNPDSTWISPDTYRDGNCCGNETRCIRFFVTTHPQSDQLSFNIATPPIPPGQFYQLDCGPYVSAGEPLCVSGTGPHCILYCKPGSDLSMYSITASKTVEASPDIAVSDGCTAEIWAIGLDEASVVWNSIFPGSVGTYNSYLDCPSGCDTTGVTPQVGYPPYIDFEVSGNLNSPCDMFSVTDTVRVHFFSDKDVEIAPEAPVVCFGESNALLTANPIGGAPPYSYVWSTGENTQSILAGVGTYWVEVYDTTVCPPVYDTVTVTQHLVPITSNAGPDQFVCINNPDVYLSGSITLATGAVWSGGLGTFSPDITSLNVTYTPTAAEIALGSITLILTTTGNQGCPAVSDIMIVTFLPEPIVDAGPDQTVCANNSTVSISGSVINGATEGIWSSSGSGTFSPSETSLNAIYLPSDADTATGTVTLTLTSANGCADISDNAIITILPAPYVDAGPDILACMSDPSVSISGIISGATATGSWTTLGSGSFSPTNTNLNTSYIFSQADTAAGQVTLVLISTNNGNCNPVTDTLIIDILDEPIVIAGPDQIICNFADAYLDGTIIGGSGTGIWTSPDGTGTFSPDHTVLNATYNPSINDYTNGQITLILTSTNNGTCLPATDNLIVTIGPTPIVFAGPNQVVCANNSNVQLAGIVSNGAVIGEWTTDGTGVFSPNSNNLDAIYVPSDADTTNGFITLTLTSSDGCQTVTDDMSIIITPGPYVNAGDDIYICYGETTADLSGAVSAGASTGQWSTLGSGTFTPSPNDLNATYNLSNADTTNGGVTLILTSTYNGNCFPVTDTVEIIMTSETTIDAGPDQTICGNMTAPLSGNIIGGIGTGIWSSPDGTGTFSPDNTSLIAEYIPSIADTVLGQVTIVLTATNSCTSVSDFFTLTIEPGPIVDAGTDQVVCVDNPNVNLTGQISSWAAPGQWNSTGTGTFLPNINDLNATYAPSAADVSSGSVDIYLTSTNNGICDASIDTIHIDILPLPVADAGGDQIICANNLAYLFGQIIGGAGTGIWSSTGAGTFLPNDTTLNATYTPGASDIVSGNVTLTLTSTNNGNCSAASDIILITIQPAPIADAGIDQTVCENNADVSLSGSVTIATGGIWTTAGSGTFSPNNTSLNTVYSPSASDLTMDNITIYLTTTGNGLCLAETDSLIINFSDSPIVNAGTDIFICEGTTSANLAGAVSGPTNSGQWSTLGSGSFFPGPDFLNTTYNLSSADITNGYVDIVLTSTNNGDCNPVTDTVRITLTGIPAVNAGSDQTVCANNAEVQLNGIVFGTPGTGAWSTSNGTGIFLPDNTDLLASYFPSDADTALGLITVILTATDACIGVRDTMLINITDAPFVDAGPDQTVCGNSSSVQLAGIIYGGASKGIWTTINGTGTFLPANTTLSANYLPSIADTAAGSVTLILTSTDNGDCLSESDTVIIYFGVNPNSNFTYPPSICVNDIANFINTSTISDGTIVAHEWDFGGGNIFTSQDAFFSFTSPGIYDIQLVEVSNIGCTDTLLLPVTVHGLPTADFSYSSICTEDSIFFTDHSTGATTWQWIFGNENFGTTQVPDSQAYNLPGNYDISLYITDINGCADMEQQVLTIHPTPDVGILFENVCVDETAIFNDITTIADDTINTWFWNFGNDNVSVEQNSTNVYTTSGTYDVSLFVATDYCSSSDTVSITVEPLPIIDIIPDTTKGCNLITINFTNNTTGASSYSWDFGDGITSIDHSPFHTFINQGTSDIIYTVEFIAYSSNGCSDSLLLDITIHPDPNSAFISDAMPGCSPLNVNFVNMSTGSTSYLWNFNDGTTSNDFEPVHEFINDTSFITYNNIVLTAISEHGCLDSTNQFITIFPTPEYEFIITPDSSCHPANVQITTVPGEYQYEWTYGDGTSETASASVWHTYENTSGNDSTYVVELITTTFFGCKDTTTNNVTVHPSPIADFLIDTLSGCTPLDIVITNLSSGVSTYYWDFGDGTTSNTTDNVINHTYYNNDILPTSYNLTLVVENDKGCTDTKSMTVTVFPSNSSEFTASDTIECSPFSISFANNSNNSFLFSWDFGDGNSSTNTHPLNTFVNSGLNDTTYTVSLISTSVYTCTDTSTLDITIHPKPEALFGLENSSGCSPFVASISNSSIGANEYLWDFGDGDTSTTQNNQLTHLYENETGLITDLTLSLIAVNSFGCSDTVVQTINIFPEIAAEFTVDTIGCTPLTLTFENLSADAVIYEWIFGDGNTSTEYSPTPHTYINTGETSIIDTASLITTSSYFCKDTASVNITIHPIPDVLFSIDEIAGCSPFEVEINNISNGVTSYNWDFGDTTHSTTSDTLIFHTYENLTPASTQYEISLYGENEYGCTDSISQFITVLAGTSTFFTHPNEGCSPLQVEFTDSSIGAVSHFWDFGDDATSGEVNPLHTFTNTTTSGAYYNVILTTTSIDDCVSSVSGEVLVYPTPDVIFSIDEIAGCSPFDVDINNISNGAASFNWNFGDTTYSNSTNATIFHTYENLTTASIQYEISLYGENEYGCADSISQIITVLAGTSAIFTPSDAGCSPLEVEFTNSSVGAVSHFWDFGDDATSGEVNPSHTFTNTTTSDAYYNVTLTTTSIGDCESSTSQEILVYATPLAEFYATPTYQVLPNSTVNVDNQTNGLWNYRWNFGDDFTSNLENPISHSYETWGEYSIRMIAEAENCLDTITHTIIIDAPPPIANFIPNAAGCAPLTVQFINQSVYADVYKWNFGDGGTSALENPKYIFYNPGIYLVTLRVEGPGGEDLSVDRQITVYDTPIAFFKAIPSTVSILDEEVTYYNLSENGHTYLWDFGDGTTDTASQPTHIYEEEGSYDIYLHVTSKEGCVDSLLLDNLILAQASCQVLFPNAFSPEVATSTENETFRPLYKGIKEYKLEIFNRWGELVFISNDPEVGWDGIYKGGLSKQDVYVWKATWVCINGEKFIKVGDVTLLR